MAVVATSTHSTDGSLASDLQHLDLPRSLSALSPASPELPESLLRRTRHIRSPARSTSAYPPFLHRHGTPPNVPPARRAPSPFNSEERPCLLALLY